MANYGPSSGFLLVGGRNLSSDVYNLTEDAESMVEQTNGLGVSWEEYKPIGLGRITLEANGGIYDDRVAGIVEGLQSAGETLQMVSYGLSGNSYGAEVVLLNGAFAANWKRIADRGGLVKANASFVVSSTYLRGKIIHPISALS